MMSSHQRLLEFALATAEEAGRLTLRYFQEPLQVEQKENLSPVTRADREAEQLIRQRVREAFPEHGIYGEEEGESGTRTERWVIDPIDGTKSFVAGVPLYSTLLSFERDGEPLVGVVVFPALGETVHAVKGEGAFWKGKRCRVNNTSELRRSTICTGSPGSLMKHGRMEGVMRLSEQAQAVRTWGDAYGHCLVATGRVEAMLDPVVEPYDISAVSLIVEEAGGKFTDFRGEHGRFREAVSCNVELQDEILAAFA